MDVDPEKGVEFIEGINFELGVENPSLGGICWYPVGGLDSDDLISLWPLLRATILLAGVANFK